MGSRASLGPRHRAGLVVGSLALAAISLSGCPRRQASQPDQRVTLVFKHAQHPRYAFLTELIQRFEAENPGIRVREEILPASTDEQHQFYVINLAARAADFDVLDMDVIWVPEFARAGWLMELTPGVTEIERAPLFPAALRADWLEEKLYAVPWFVDAGVLYYRKDLLDKHGFLPPQTYPELLETARSVLTAERDPKLTGFIWQGKQYEGLVCSALEFIRGNGGDLLREGGWPALTEPATLEALQFMSDMVRRYDVTPPLVTTLNEEASRHIFQSGRAIFMRNWPYAWPLMQQPGSRVAGRIGMTLVPHFPGHTSRPTLGGFHVGVNARSTHKKEALAFIRFLLRYDVQKQILLKVGVLPAHRQVYDDAEVRQKLPQISELLRSLQQVEPRPATPYYMMISHILQPELSAVVAGIRPPKQAMRSAELQVEHLLGLL